MSGMVTKEQAKALAVSFRGFGQALDRTEHEKTDVTWNSVAFWADTLLRDQAETGIEFHSSEQLVWWRDHARRQRELLRASVAV